MNFAKTGFSGFNSNCVFFINSKEIANIYEKDGEYVGDFDGAGSYAAFWLDDTDPKNPDKAFCRIIVASSNELKITSQDRKSFGASVRCVKIR